MQANPNLITRALEDAAFQLADAEHALRPAAPELALRAGRVWVQVAERVNVADTRVPTPMRDEPDGY